MGCLAWGLALAIAVPGPQVMAGRTKPAARDKGADLRGFEAGFAAGQQQFDRGEFLEAARTWAAAAALLPETTEHRSNRAAIHEYMADAYERALAGSEDPELLREGLAPLDRSAEQLAAADPAAALPGPVVTVREDLRARLERLAAPPPVVAPEPVAKPEPSPAPPPSRPWKGLAAGGGVALAGGVAMLSLFAVGFTRARARTKEFDDPARGCALPGPEGECAEIYSAGKSANTLAVVGLVTAPLLVGAGVAMLVVATRRRGTTQALTPTLGRGFVGVSWERRF